MIKLPTLWLGEYNQYAAFLNRIETFKPIDGMLDSRHLTLNKVAHQKIGLLADGTEEEDLSLEDMLALELIEVYDNVGVIKIEGSLVPEESIFNLWFGAVSYSSVSRALTILLEDESVSDIVMAYSTNGGSAEGIGEASDAILAADRIKPVYSWTGSAMLSAGYWLGASARKVYGTKVARIGSIGVVATFTSYARARKEAGYDTTVVRSAPMKAVPHPYEPLTKKGEAVLQSSIDFFHTLFTDHVVSVRPGLSSANSDETWATGEAFFGEEAMQMGLVDGPLQPLDSLLSNLIGAHNAQQQTSGGIAMPKRLVIQSEAARAAIMAGVPGQLIEEEIVPPAASLQGDPETPEDQETPETPETPEPAAEAPASTVEVAAAPAAGEGLAVMLQAQLEENKALQEKVIRLQIENERLTNTSDELNTMRPALETAIQRLEVGLGHRPSDVAALSAAALVSTYDHLYAELMKLPVGRQSLPGSEEGSVSEMATVIQQRLTSIPGGKR